MSMRLDDEELDLLSGHGASALGHAAKLAYILGIRPYMDFETGLVGYKRRVSYQSLRELLEVAPVPGSHRAERQFTVEAIRVVLRELERAGLILWIKSRDRGLFFECLVAHRGHPSKNRNNMGTTSRSPMRMHPEESSTDAGLMGDEAHEEHHQDPTEEQHTSGSPVINTTPNTRARTMAHPTMPSCIPHAAWEAYLEERNRITGRVMSIGQRLALSAELVTMDMEGYDLEKVLRRCIAYGYATFDRRHELKKKPPGATNQTPGASASTTEPKRGHYGEIREFDNSAAARTRRASERWRREQESEPGADESSVILEGRFDRLTL